MMMNVKAYQLLHELTTPTLMSGASFAHRHLMADAVAEKLVQSHGTCHRIFHKQHVCLHGSKTRAEEEVNERAINSGDVNSMVDSELKMLDRIITGDEMWCYLYDPQTRRHNHHT
jgi:hypothetical protein